MVYSDLELESVYKLPDTAIHRDVELAVLSASPKVKTHIVSPPTIYGIADHALVRKGISNPISMQLPTIIRASLDRKQAGMVGKGLNVWPCIHTTESTCLPYEYMPRDYQRGTQSLRRLLRCSRQQLQERRPLVARDTILQVCNLYAIECWGYS
jgi:hypothetical protein